MNTNTEHLDDSLTHYPDPEEGYMDVEQIAESVLSNMTEEDKNVILHYGEREQLHRLHQGLGRDIRNEYNLWERPFEPQINDEGVDVSPEHPDAVSMQVIETIYEQLASTNEE